MTIHEGGNGARPVVVAIPARDEAATIGNCLKALGQQTHQPTAVILLLNNCIDQTEEIARGIVLPFRLDIQSVTLPACDANAGTARRLVMDSAARLAGQNGVVMTSDADAIVPPTWIASNMRALAAGADVVCGQAVIDPHDALAIPVHLQVDDALEREYSELLDAIADKLCPDPADPRSRHTEASGASLAMSVKAFRGAGGVPGVPTGEDRALIGALQRIDARIRHDPTVCVVVSGRTIGRANGGMADIIRRRMIRQDVFADASLEPPGDALRRADFRRRLRTAWFQRFADPDLVADLQISPAVLDACLPSRFFGTLWDEVKRACPMLTQRRVRFADLPQHISHARELLSLVEVKILRNQPAAE